MSIQIADRIKRTFFDADPIEKIKPIEAFRAFISIHTALALIVRAVQTDLIFLEISIRA